MTSKNNTKNTRKRNTRNSKSASMKVRVPGAKRSVDSMKYEIANEIGAKSARSKVTKKNSTNKSKKAK